MDASSPACAIETAGLCKRYGGIAAVDGIDLRVPAGAVFGFLGPNGAGKTTTIRLLLGLVRPDAGRVRLDGFDVQRERERALARVGAIVESPALYAGLTGEEQLSMLARLLRRPAARVREVLAVVGLEAAAKRTVRTYSLGMRQRLALARALLGEPRLLILDEPTNGLDPAGIADMRALIRELPRRFGATVLLSSHLLSEIEQTADHCALIESGRLRYQGRLDRLLAGGGARLVLETDDVTAAAAWFRERGHAVATATGELRVDADFDAVARAALTAALVDARIGVSGLRVERPGLEALFLRMTSAEAAA